MNGKIGVDSQPGKGIRFLFTVVFSRPLDQVVEPLGEASSASCEESLRNRFAGTGVLVVEDDLVNQAVISEMLSDVGLLVDIANDGLEALAMINPERHTLVLMDIQMPRMNGVNTTIAMRRKLELRNLPSLR